MTDDTVYVKCISQGGSRRIYHTDPECPNIPSNAHEVERSKLWDSVRECMVCSGDMDRVGACYSGLSQTLKDTDPEDIGL